MEQVLVPIPHHHPIHGVAKVPCEGAEHIELNTFLLLVYDLTFKKIFVISRN